jgi:hypothetical protein
MTTPERRQFLLDNIDKLPEKDQGFARSICGARYPSEKQWHWIGKLADRIDQPQRQRDTANIGGMDGVIALFTAGAQSLKWPAIVLQNEHTGEPFKLTIAGPRAAHPGTVNVIEYRRFDPDEGRKATWYGRVLLDGTFEISPKFTSDKLHGIIVKLQQLSADPVRVATEYGRLTGHCCFCRLPLKDARSTAVGYGRTCAKNWGVSWGEVETSFAAVTVQPMQEPAPQARKASRRIRVGA